MEPVYRDWTVVKPIGSGSYGEVYEIERESLGHIYKAALKIIKVPQSDSQIADYQSSGNWSKEETAEHFLGVAKDIVKEFEIMYELRGHSNIVCYEDHDIHPHEDGIGLDIMLRMELLTPLDKYINNPAHQFTRREVIRLGIDMCKALERCQTFDVVHRDIKPSNIFVSEAGDYKLGDFGIAKTVESQAADAFEMSKRGTYNYMAPEIYHGQEAGFAVDQYSLGIVLYRLLNHNRIPFMPPYPLKWNRYDNEKAVAMRMSGKVEMPMPSQDHTRLAEIVLKACSFLPESRYSSPTAMRKDLEAILYEEHEWDMIRGESDQIHIPNEATPSTGAGSSSSISQALYGEDATATLNGVQPAAELEETVLQPSDTGGGEKPINLIPAIIIALILVIAAVAVLILHPFGKSMPSQNGDTAAPSASSSVNDESSGSAGSAEGNPDGSQTTTEREIGDAGYTLERVYDGEQLLRETQYHADGTLGFTYEYTYDEDGNQLQESVVRPDGTVWRKTERTYEDGLLSKETSYENDVLTSYSLHGWNEDGTEKEYTLYNEADQVTEYHTFDYAENGTYTETVQAGETGVLSQSTGLNGDVIDIAKVIYFYDVSGQMERQSDYDANDELVDYCEIKYDYRFRQTQQSWYYGNGIVEGHVEYDYSEDGSTTEETLYDANGKILLFIQNEHGADGRLTITQYDKERSIVAQEVYDEEGNSLSRDDYGTLTDSGE